MPAYMMPLDLRERAFLECIRWADVVCPNLIVVIDIDFEEFNLALFGADDDIQEFSKTVQDMLFSCEEKIDEKEREHYG